MAFKFLRISRTAGRSVLDLLYDNIIGTPGIGMLYQHRGVDEKIPTISNPFFVNLFRNDSLIATCCFCSRATINAGESIRGFYVRYFSFSKAFRRERVFQKKNSRHSALRNEVNDMLMGRGLDVAPGAPFFHYAYVDPRNVRSATLCREFGFETVRRFSAVIFSRLNPKPQQNVYEAAPSDHAIIHERISEFHKTYTMFSLDNLLKGDPYYIAKHEDKIVAGLQVRPERWKIHSLPGITGKIILQVIPHIPYLRRLIDNEYRFLSIEGIFYQPGFGQRLQQLLEHALYRHRIYSAIVNADLESELYATMKSLHLGPVSKMNKEVRVDVICRFESLTASQREIFLKKPAYISGSDLS